MEDGTAMTTIYLRSLGLTFSHSDCLSCKGGCGSVSIIVVFMIILFSANSFWRNGDALATKFDA